MNSNAATNAILLVIAGFLGFIAAHVTGTTIFALGGFVAFLFAAAIGVGSFLRGIKEGYESRETTTRVKPSADPYANVPTNVDPAKRTHRPYSSL